MGHHHHHGHDPHHGHDHHHPHVHAPSGGDPRRALVIALVLNGGFLGVELVVGLLTGSLAVLSDAAHMVSDVAALALALGAAQLARRAATARMTFGLHRAETLGAFVNGLALFAAVAVITWEAVERLVSGPPEIGGLPVLVVGVVGLAINLGSAWALWRSDRDNLNIRGALLHMLADALGSVGAVIAAVLLMLGLPAADPIVSLFIAGLVAWGAWGVTRDSGRVLLQLPPTHTDVDGLLDDLLHLEGIEHVHDLHVWTLDGRAPIVTAHLVGGAELDAQALVDRATDMVRERHGSHHATFQVEAADAPPCASDACGAPRGSAHAHPHAS